MRNTLKEKILAERKFQTQEDKMYLVEVVFDENDHFHDVQRLFHDFQQGWLQLKSNMKRND